MDPNRHTRLVSIIREHGLRSFDQPVALASGELSRDFVDGKAALARGADLELACRAMLDALGDVEFDAVGGLTMGADQFAHGIAMLADRRWFVVRKEPKGRGTRKLVEGAELEPGTRVVLAEDVVTTGGSILRALEAVEQLEADVVAAVALVDRGESAAPEFERRGIPYLPLVSYRDLGIEPIGLHAGRL
ncbi:MAG: orotate phosphoribosyltransferase [Gaiellales bacterium]